MPSSSLPCLKLPETDHKVFKKDSELMPNTHKITLGISPCPNDIYIFSGLLLGEVPTGDLAFTTRFEDIETLNLLAQQGQIDVVKISYANYVHCAAHYELLPRGGALGRGVGPLLLSNGGEWSPDREILVPGEYTTANFLLDYYVQQPVRKRFLPFDTLYAELCAVPGSQGVVIHEKRFTFEADGLTLLQDLGSHWEQKTGYAIPLGAIAVRRESGIYEAIDAIVAQSLQWAKTHHEAAFALCRQYAQDLTEGVVQAHIGLYVNDYSEHLGAEGTAAVDYFLDQQRKF